MRERDHAESLECGPRRVEQVSLGLDAAELRRFDEAVEKCGTSVPSVDREP